MRNLLHIKTFVSLTIIGVLTTFTATALQTYFPILLQQHDTFGMTSGQAGTYAGLILGPVAIVGVLLGGYLADWLTHRYAGARLLIIISSVLLVLPLNVTSLLLATTHNLVLFSAFMIPTFFINTLHLAPLAAAFLDIVPSESRASAVAISLFVQGILGRAAAPLVIGMLAGFLLEILRYILFLLFSLPPIPWYVLLGVDVFLLNSRSAHRRIVWVDLDTRAGPSYPQASNGHNAVRRW
jgi:MFS family permease